MKKEKKKNQTNTKNMIYNSGTHLRCHQFRKDDTNSQSLEGFVLFLYTPAHIPNFYILAEKAK